MFRLSERTVEFLPSLPLSRLKELIGHLEEVVAALDKTKSISLHREVDQSWYMQKLAEIALLRDQRMAAENRLFDIQRRLNRVVTDVTRQLDWDSMAPGGPMDVSAVPEHVCGDLIRTAPM